MKEEHQDFDCFLCFSQNIQHKMITSSLLRRLKSLIIIWQQKFPIPQKIQEKVSFSQLLKVLYGGQMKRFSNQCRHDKFQRYLLNKLDCSRQILYLISDKLLNHIAEKNYHLELVSQQIKNVAESISEGKVQASFKKITQTQSSLKSYRKRNFHQKQLENQRFEQFQLQQDKDQIKSQLEIGSEQPQFFPSFTSLSFISLQNPNEPVKVELPPENIPYYYYLNQIPYFSDKKQ